MIFNLTGRAPAQAIQNRVIDLTGDANFWLERLVPSLLGKLTETVTLSGNCRHGHASRTRVSSALSAPLLDPSASDFVLQAWFGEHRDGSPIPNRCHVPADDDELLLIEGDIIPNADLAVEGTWVRDANNDVVCNSPIVKTLTFDELPRLVHVRVALSAQNRQHLQEQQPRVELRTTTADGSDLKAFYELCAWWCLRSGHWVGGFHDPQVGWFFHDAVQPGNASPVRSVLDSVPQNASSITFLYCRMDD